MQTCTTSHRTAGTRCLYTYISCIPGSVGYTRPTSRVHKCSRVQVFKCTLLAHLLSLCLVLLPETLCLRQLLLRIFLDETFILVTCRAMAETLNNFSRVVEYKEPTVLAHSDIVITSIAGVIAHGQHGCARS
jgi:hypothetical protein